MKVAGSFMNILACDGGENDNTGVLTVQFSSFQMIIS